MAKGEKPSRLQFLGKNWLGISPDVSAQQRKNVYLEVNDDDESGKVTVYNTPGLDFVKQFNGSNVAQMLYSFGDYLLVMYNNILYTINPGFGGLTELGATNTVGSNINVTDNGTQIMLCDDYGNATIVVPSVYSQPIKSVQYFSNVPEIASITYLNPPTMTNVTFRRADNGQSGAFITNYTLSDPNLAIYSGDWISVANNNDGYNTVSRSGQIDVLTQSLINLGDNTYKMQCGMGNTGFAQLLQVGDVVTITGSSPSNLYNTVYSRITSIITSSGNIIAEYYVGALTSISACTQAGTMTNLSNGVQCQLMPNGDIYFPTNKSPTAQTSTGGNITIYKYYAKITTQKEHNLTTGQYATLQHILPTAYSNDKCGMITVVNDLTFLLDIGNSPVSIIPTLLPRYYTMVYTYPLLAAGYNFTHTNDILTITCSQSVATVTTAQPHGLRDKQLVLISGVRVDGFNGRYPIIVVDEYTFDYVLPVNITSNTTNAGGYWLSTDNPLDAEFGNPTIYMETQEPHNLSDGMKIIIRDVIFRNGNTNITLPTQEVTIYRIDEYNLSFILETQPSVLPFTPNYQATVNGEYSISSCVSPVTSSGFLGATATATLVGYTINAVPLSDYVFRPDVFQISNWNDASNYDATLTAVAETATDGIVQLLVMNGILVIFGKTTTEFWVPSGNGDLPFSPVSGSAKEVGLYAKNSVAKLSKEVAIFLGVQSGRCELYMLRGYEITSIKNNAFEYVINKYSNLSIGQAFSYSLNGHNFYQISFKDDNKTWLYDETTDCFSMLDSGNGRSLADLFAIYNGYFLITDYSNSNIYQLNFDVYTENGSIVTREIVSRHQLDSAWYVINEFMLTMETGNIFETNYVPQALLSTSKDGGHSFSMPIATNIGGSGQYGLRVRWTRLGRARDVLFKVQIRENMKIAITGAWVRYE